MTFYALSEVSVKRYVCPSLPFLWPSQRGAYDAYCSFRGQRKEVRMKFISL